jgi:DNA-directed RNA polymerase subunit RPC12/RpoP
MSFTDALGGVVWYAVFIVLLALASIGCNVVRRFMRASKFHFSSRGPYRWIECPQCGSRLEFDSYSAFRDAYDCPKCRSRVVAHWRVR